MEGLLPLIIQLISGGAGGNIAGALLKNLSLGPVGNTIAGIIGGYLGGNFLGPAIGMGGGADLAGILSEVLSGGVGGGATMAVAGILKSMFSK